MTAAIEKIKMSDDGSAWIVPVAGLPERDNPHIRVVWDAPFTRPEIHPFGVPTPLRTVEAARGLAEAMGIAATLAELIAEGVL
ncbi:hypothetical protein SEA_LILBEANIE_6 [Gordonia phage Lilbeanie]|uniref:Uncharacterized protein n=1 Tax=Gordonia phage Lilbeanie TaxID=2794947 RepID=A0A7T1NWG8_9CAUD|nr:hypothetical protein J1773_gp06 [Gordonia phage Lilbeanie]QPO17085.1 hypothetical protein SEA_LILBEANIE_6 [Gordonia phage Lilbeanie]